MDTFSRRPSVRHGFARYVVSALLLATLILPAAVVGRSFAQTANNIITPIQLENLRADLREIAAATSGEGTDVSLNEPRPQALGGTEWASVVVELSAPAAIERLTTARSRGFVNADELAATQVDMIERQQDRFSNALASAAPEATEIYRLQRVFNGVALNIDVDSLERIAAIPSVKAIHPLVPHYIDHTSSVPMIGAPEVWAAASLGLTGENIDIGIIDTGIDYIHTGFGGPGSIAYDANNTLVITDTFNGAPLFPSAKVVGGYDFVGDEYDASVPSTSTPAPDPDPMDCNGHGSHVAGTAAGFGVNADGSTYTGAYDTNVDFAGMRIGPGVAPQANLYALRVFGCDGSTGVTAQAIEWAVDPNADGDFSDRLDVINMSLGSGFGSIYDVSVVASDRAAELGVIVVTSAGNNNDVQYITGSPGVATRALSVASSVDAQDVVDGFEVVTGPAGLIGPHPATFSANYDWAASAPLTATLTYTSTFTGCSAATPEQQALITGTIVLVDWAPPGSSTFFCGSAGRANNAFNAGAVGVIMASGQPSFDTAIAGNSTVRAVFTTFTVGDALKTALESETVEIRFSNEYRNSNKFLQPQNEDTLSNFSSRGPRRVDSALKPDMTMPGQSIFSVATGTGNEGFSLNGTSMAAPHAAGMMALLRQLHPTWTVEELKALAMNTATNDLFTGANRSGNTFGPGRIGTGRGDVPDAAASTVIAYNADTPGAVSVSFGMVEVVPGSVITQTRTIRVVNKGDAAVTYDAAFITRVDSPGVSFSVSPSSVELAAGASADLVVTMTADPAQMKRGVRDITMAATQSGNPRHWLGEETGFVELTATDEPTLRVTTHAAPRLAATVRASDTGIILPDASGTLTVTLEGDGVATAPEASFGVSPTEDFSVLTAFELQEVSPRIPDAALSAPSVRGADLSHIGIMSNIAAAATITDTTVYFGIASHGDFSIGSASDTEFDVYIDTNDSGISIDGTGNIVGAEYILFNWSIGSAANTGANDTFISVLVNTSTNGLSIGGFTNIVNANINTNIYNNNVLVLPVDAADLGLTDGASKINYQVISFSREAEGSVDLSNVLSYDVATPGLALPNVAYLAEAGALGMDYNRANFEAAESLGLLLLHHHNSAATGRVDALLAPVDLAVAVTGPSSLLPETSAVFTTTVTNNSPRAANGVSMTLTLPTGLSASNVNGATCTDATGNLACNIDNVAASGSTVITMTVTTSSMGGVYDMTATVSGTADDPALANNTSSFSLAVPGLVVSLDGDSLEVVENGATDTYSVSLSVAPTSAVTITAVPDANLDLGAGAGISVTLTFTPENWNVPQVVTVTAVADGVNEGAHTGTITHSVGSDGNYAGLAAPSLTVAITDQFVLFLPFITRE